MSTQSLPNPVSSTTPENPPVPEPVGIPPSASGEFSTGSNAGQKSRTPRACNFFAAGNCRYGAECRFSHDPTIVARYVQYQQSQNRSYGNGQGHSPKVVSSDNAAASNHTGEEGGSPNPDGADGDQGHHGNNHHHHYFQTYYPYGHHSPSHNNNQGPAPSYKVVNIPPGKPVFSIDVECVATGVQHNSRSVAQVSLVDEWCRPLFNAYIKQDKPVVSYLTQLTGITKETLENEGRPLAEVMVELRSFLSPQAVLVGQSIHKDVQWLQLVEGMDFESMINLAHLFRVWNPQRSAYTSFSQDHCAKVWLGMGERTNHDAVTDATISMSLFNMYRQIQVFPDHMLNMQQQTLRSPRVPGFSRLYPVIEGCCMGNKSMCNCGAPFE